MTTTLPYGTDQIIDTDTTRSLHADACRSHAALAWAVMWDLPAYPERYAARLATSTASLTCCWRTHWPASGRCRRIRRRWSKPGLLSEAGLYRHHLLPDCHMESFKARPRPYCQP